ncbi:methyltransferase domain-containing protein [Paenibacillus sp. LHD-117]|uniref:class I SAM-dependent methyltransferase n=1 Tax=Paenibacillus sp. LHD-117 TaxID=3071412 RepID=UPI0027E0EC9C|nr:methyltransferase domain-containing protein [Paenibacillus sp. LHD-117]MDQ6422471.1 methyltransferase domain-containing protein [Paenibacillus sp. LHD-117]
MLTGAPFNLAFPLFFIKNNGMLISTPGDIKLPERLECVLLYFIKARGVRLFTNSRNQKPGVTIQAIKQHRLYHHPLIRAGVSVASRIRNAARTAVRAITSKEFRSIIQLRVLNAQHVHQTTPLTSMNRYPVIFSACRDYLGDNGNLKILSYGCSTGEEVLTLRQYFPTAHIVGAEINKHSLAVCKKRSVDEKITFVHSSFGELQKHGKFDAIFCMAVLQRKPNLIEGKGITSLQKIYPFEKFEKQLIDLDKLLKPQGLLTVHYTQYSIMDTTIAPQYESLGDYNQDDYRSPVFDKNSLIIRNPVSRKSIFVKKPNEHST